jgi:two-component system, NtrC family, response regulator GlrR
MLALQYRVGPRAESSGSKVETAFGALIGTSPALLKQTSQLPVFARCDANVLILGETGSGKEVCAQAVHALSTRASGPWVAVNCGAIPSELVENELFGHVRGAYTTAHDSHEGLVRQAESGTLFFDEVDCLAASAQIKLLRFLQDRQYRPVGSTRVIEADVRIIAASNEELSDLVMAGAFRQDLYFRLNVLSLRLPPLRERLEDIPVLAQAFAQGFAVQYGRAIKGISTDAMSILLAYRWPGNVRELKNVIERAVLLAAGDVLIPTDIELPGLSGSAAENSFREAKARVVEQFEKTYLEGLLSTHAGNITHAALAAKKNRRAFFRLLKKHRVDAERFRSR